MSATPSWKAARNGLPGDLNATNLASEVNQPLGTHGVFPIYQGSQVLTPVGSAGTFQWVNLGNATDLDQPFVLSGTSVGRVVLPLLPVGNGADLLVSLYPDTAGVPDTTNLLASTLLPREWINTLAAPNGMTEGGPLAVSKFNTTYSTGGVSQTPWTPSNTTSGGNSTQSGATTSGNFIISAGGANPTTSDPTNIVTSTQYVGNRAVNLPLPQPGLPIAVSQAGTTTTSNLMIVAGGQTSGTGPTVFTGNSYVASWDPNTGVLGSWSQQTTIPTALLPAAMVTFNDTYVYVVGGVDAVNTSNRISRATITNGQLSAWVACTPLLQLTDLCFVAVIGTWMLVAGGVGATTKAYYSKIYPDGSLGGWNVAPTIPAASAETQNGWDTVVTDHALILLGGSFGGPTNQIFTLSVDDVSGVGDSWNQTVWPHTISSQAGGFNTGDGTYDVISLSALHQYYEATSLVPVPTISVPLYATGLTNGNKYHVVLQQRQVASASDYLSYGLVTGALPVDSLSSPRNANIWTTYSSGNSMPMSVFNTAGGPNVLHTWEDPSVTGSTYTSNLAARTTTRVYDYMSMPIGYLESTLLPNDPFNSNPTFTSGTSPWVATNGTVTQSSAQVHGGFAFSGLLTPTGGNPTAFIRSEKMRVTQGVFPYGADRWLHANGWFYVPTTWGSVSPSIEWYDSAGVLISTSAAAKSVTGATWTNLVNFAQVPSGATSAALVAILSGTPTSANTLFVSNFTLEFSLETSWSFASVSEVVRDPITNESVGVTFL